MKAKEPEILLSLNSSQNVDNLSMTVSITENISNFFELKIVSLVG